MKTVFETTTRAELIGRINALNENSKAIWGKMNVYQMTRHCAIWSEWVLGKNNPTYKQGFLGKVFGKTALKNNTKNDAPMKKNIPAGVFKVKSDDGNLEMQKKIWKDLITDYVNFSNPGFIHDFFGKMTKEEIGIFSYKHFDHHLRQFGV